MINIAGQITPQVTAVSSRTRQCGTRTDASGFHILLPTWTIGDAVHVDDLAALIQRRMDEKGWTISTIARRSGLAVSTVHAWKAGDRARGNRGPTPDKLRQLAEGLDLPVAVVFEAAGRRVPAELSPEDQSRFLHVLAELSEDDRQVLLATAEAMRSRSRS